MSYDVDIGDRELAYTYNVSAMFLKAAGETPSDWNGLRGKDIIPRCDKILAAFAENPQAYRGLNPRNGWGDFEGARNFIRAIRDECADHPEQIIIAA